jgi:nucleoside-diphosphate-sugar epimerase
MLMTGLVIGCGYLGRRVVLGWCEQGWTVFATTRRPERFDELRSLGARPVGLDVLDPAALHRLPLATMDAIVFAVGMDRAAGLSMRTVYVEGLDAVLTGLSSQSARPRFVYVSSTSVYGQMGGEEVDEASATEPMEEAGQVILEAERTLLRHRPDAIRLRFAGIYGPGRLIRSQALQAGTPMAGDPDHWLNLIHVEDGARVVLAAVERGQPGAVYNVSDDRPVRRQDFYARLADLLGAPAPRFTPSPPADRTNRRIVACRLRQELGVVLRYPTFAEGLAACAGQG